MFFKRHKHEWVNDKLKKFYFSHTYKKYECLRYCKTCFKRQHGYLIQEIGGPSYEDRILGEYFTEDEL